MEGFGLLYSGVKREIVLGFYKNNEIHQTVETFENKQFGDIKFSIVQPNNIEDMERSYIQNIAKTVKPVGKQNKEVAEALHKHFNDQADDSNCTII